MGKVSVSQRVTADADAIWELIGDFNGLASWADGVTSCSGDGHDVGSVRVVELADGRRLRERLESLDEVGRSYSYSLTEGGRGADDCLATLKVWANRDGSAEIVWSAEFDAEGAPEGAGGARIEVFYRSSLAKVSERFT
jgi:hypothetical protein